MNGPTRLLLLLCVGVVAAHSLSLFQLLPSDLYYGDYFSELSLRCQEYAWDEHTSIVFFANGAVLFNSSDATTKCKCLSHLSPHVRAFH